MEKIRLGTPQPTATVNRFTMDLTASHGQGGCTIDLFSSGLKLIIMETALNRPVQIANPVVEPVVGFGFCLAGKFDAISAFSLPSFTVRAGESGFFSFPGNIEITERIATDHMLRLYLMLEGELLSSFAQGDEDNFSPVFKSLDKQRPCRMVHPTTALMQAVLNQMLHCPYCGKAKRLYLESKAMELLSHKLDQLTPSTMSRNKEINRSDYEGVRHAAEILVNNLENPPNTTHLARSVGLSRSKLHRCFRRVYGVSPFEYLRNHRLQTAMLLLQSGEINVTEAALRVGYTNLSYFAKAFKALFGVAPGELLHNSGLCQSSF